MFATIMTGPEIQYIQSEPLQESLLTGRYNAAVRTAERQLRGVFAVDPTKDPRVSLSQVRDSYYGGYDCGVLRPSELIAFDAVDVRITDLTKDTGGYNPESSTLVQSIQVEDEHVDVHSYGRGVSLQFRKEGHEPDPANPLQPTAITERIRQRFAQSPAHREMARINVELQSQPTTPPSIETNPFDPMEDPLGTAAFLEQVGLTDSGYSFARQLREGHSIADIVESSLNDVPGYRATQTEDDTSKVFTWGSGAVKSLAIDKQTGAYTFSVRMDPASNYFETPNQAPGIEAIPFIETECAQELCRLLDRSGLMFHPKYQLTMMEMGDSDRFGSIYTQLTREVAKWVNSPDRTHLSNLFVPADMQYQGSRLAGDSDYPTLKLYEYEAKNHQDVQDGTTEADVRSTWNRIDHSVQGEAAGALVTMIDDVLSRGNNAATSTDLSVTSKRIEVSNGACFDVASYYVGAADQSWRTNDLRKISDGGVELLEKTHGSHTYLSLHPMQFNGVQLPKGALFSRQQDGWAFLRLTPFSFDNLADQLALAPEIAKTGSNEKQAIQALGGMTLTHLAQAVER
ncbi:MAG TPA: hypothetical protein VK978_01855 [Candidatus Saccharimonadales bacterium]|nr:hypothetical protein [Candidatus Saccharimonadales bacterium]